MRSGAHKQRRDVDEWDTGAHESVYPIITANIGTISPPNILKLRLNAHLCSAHATAGISFLASHIYDPVMTCMTDCATEP